MGYLDKQSRVVDFVLTERGRKLYAIGQLDFTYFSLLDDGLDYDPYSTGTLSDPDREVQVTALPMWEAPYVRVVRDTTAPLEPTSHLFRAAAGYVTVPFMSSPPSSGSSLDLMCDQARVDGSYRRTGTNVAQIDLSIQGQAETVNPGFQVRVFSSGTGGISEIFPRRDLSGRRSFDPFLAAVIDDERSVDSVKIDDPSSKRTFTNASGPDLRGSKR